MINKDNFLRVLELTSAQTGFPLLILEKDYYLTLVLSDINRLSENLIFKGGTCLNKIYYSYYRLSEDLDFTMMLPPKTASRNDRRKGIKVIKDNIRDYLRSFDMGIDEVDNTGQNESSQYIFDINYNSTVTQNKQSIKLEISLRFNPILPPQTRRIRHKFLHPFTEQPLFDGGTVRSLALKELVAEKMRATATRRTIAPRDFYDISFLIKAGFDFQDKQLWNLFKAKLIEDGFGNDITKYRTNMGRSGEEIAQMSSRIETELLDVLTVQERKEFDIVNSLEQMNLTLKNMC